MQRIGLGLYKAVPRLASRRVSMGRVPLTARIERPSVVRFYASKDASDKEREASQAKDDEVSADDLKTGEKETEEAVKVTNDANVKEAQAMSVTRQDLMVEWIRTARDIPQYDLKALEYNMTGRDTLSSRCIIIGEDGSFEQMEKKLQKQKLHEQFGIQARDLRPLDAHIMDVKPNLVICSKSIIVCTPVTRAIISHDRLVLIGPDEHNPLMSDEDTSTLARVIRSGIEYLSWNGNGVFINTDAKEKTPFEFKALEVLLYITSKSMRRTTDTLQRDITHVVTQLHNGIGQETLHELLQYKRTVEDALFSGKAIQEALNKTLSDDTDLSAMYLTDKAHNVMHNREDHQSVELLLEYYERQFDENNEILSRLSHLLTDMDNNIALVLANTRVRLQNLDLQTSIVSLSFASGTAIAGFFGMNLYSGYESHQSMFYIATGASLALMTAIGAIGFLRLMKNQKMMYPGSRK